MVWGVNRCGREGLMIIRYIVDTRLIHGLQDT